MKRSYSGLFKSFFDVIDKDALAGKPVLIAATGGTARHSLVLEHALRLMTGLAASAPAKDDSDDFAVVPFEEQLAALRPAG